MFTGIVEEKGKVIAFTKLSKAWQLKIEAHVVCDDAALGDSIAVNGCCLTVASFTETTMSFDVLEETRRLTNFSTLNPGTHVNLERSLRFDGKVGGHFVTGHIDGIGIIEVLDRRGADIFLKVKISSDCGKFIVQKGSIAIDGISLTVAEVGSDSFAVWIIPTTIEVTNLIEKVVGGEVNLEFDLIGKYVEKLTRLHQSKE